MSELSIEERLERIEHAIHELIAWAAHDPALLCKGDGVYRSVHDIMHLDPAGYADLMRRKRGEG